jgi:alpha-D-xyloside xylohydrolase
MFAVEGDLIDYYFFFGPSLKKILNTYTDLTGKPTTPPKWSFGTWISRISYYSQKQVMAVAQRLRKMQFPSDVIHIDTGWFDVDWRCDWKFNAERFPDPAAMFKMAREMGFRICLWQTPYVLKDTGIYRDAKKKGVLARNRGPFVFLFLYPGSPIDFSNPEGVKWYKERLKDLLRMGAATIKIDFGEGVEPSMRFKHYGGRQMHNLYPLLYQKAGFEAIEEVYGEGQAVIWARGGYAGCQRYPTHWSGDNSSNHENLLSSLRGGLSLGLSGFTFWSQDTGGFVGVPSDEVYTRWTQLSIFQSHLRFHGCPPNYKEPWNFSPETQRIVRDYLNLRYRLIPYLYTEAQVAAREGLPILRHLVIDFQDDPTVYNIEDQYMCGRHILVAPILTKNNHRSIYLPDGCWYDFWTGERLNGKQWIDREVDLETIPAYIRGGIALPLAKLSQSTDDLSNDGMTVRLYPNEEGQAAYTLMERDDRIVVNAHVKRRNAEVELNPELSNVFLQIPNSVGISEVKLNSKKTKWSTI